MKKQYRCLFCNAPLHHVFVDLGTCPPSNAFLAADDCDTAETFYPLRVYICEHCMLVQSPFFKCPQEIFTHDYVYHSSWSSSWVDHAHAFVDKVCERFQLNERSLVVEIGSNDGYLLQHVLANNIPCLGVDPSAGAASVAQTKGIMTITDFFSARLANHLVEQGKRADLICGINVFSHVPDINDLISGVSILLKPDGVFSMEFPHLLRLIEETQFDTIYHEHYFYYSFFVVEQLLKKHGLSVFDVETLPTHGGSLRVYSSPSGAERTVSDAVYALRALEEQKGMKEMAYYQGFQNKLFTIRRNVIEFLIGVIERNEKIIGYGAAAKGNTLLNYFGIKKDLLPCVVDASPIKQGKFLPGSRIPVLPPTAIRRIQPDYLFVLPWNLKEEIEKQHGYIREWGGKFVTAIPELTIW